MDEKPIVDSLNIATPFQSKVSIGGWYKCDIFYLNINTIALKRFINSDEINHY